MHSIRPNSKHTHTLSKQWIGVACACRLQIIPTIPWTHTHTHCCRTQNVSEFVRNRKFINVDRKRLSLFTLLHCAVSCVLYTQYIVLDTFSTNTSSPQSLFSLYCCHWSLFFVTDWTRNVCKQLQMNLFAEFALHLTAPLCPSLFLFRKWIIHSIWCVILSIKQHFKKGRVCVYCNFFFSLSCSSLLSLPLIAQIRNCDYDNGMRNANFYVDITFGLIKHWP